MNNFHFNKDVAIMAGVEPAIIFDAICFWVEINKASNTSLREGKYWTYNSLSAFAEFYPFWTTDQIRRYLEKLESADLVQTAFFGGTDRRKSYSLTDFGEEVANGINLSKAVLKKRKIGV